MRIGIDVRCFAQEKNTGVEGYTKNMLTELFTTDTENEYILFFNAWHGCCIDFSWATKHKNVSVKKYAIPNKILNFCLWFLHYPRLDKMCGGVDIFFMPNPNFAALSHQTKLFLTIHDLSFEHCKDTFSLKRRFWHFFVNPRLLARNAFHIFTVSEATKADLCTTYGISEKKITVAQNGLPSITRAVDRNNLKLIKVKERHALPHKFILCFGTIEPRKNIVRIIDAFGQLRTKYANISHKLVIAGAQGWKSKEIYAAANISPYKHDIMILTDIPENDKAYIYTLASVFVYPSFFEGFGFPPLEAIACHIPTIVSHTTSLPEVVGEHAVMIDPMRTGEITQALQEVIANRQLQGVLCKNVYKYKTRFQWKQAATIFLREINKCIHT